MEFCLLRLSALNMRSKCIQYQEDALQKIEYVRWEGWRQDSGLKAEECLIHQTADVRCKNVGFR